VSATAAKPVGVALSGEHLAVLLADRKLAGLLDGAGFAFAIAGVDRIDGSSPAGRTVESTIAAAVLAARAPRLGWLAAAAVHRDHPYNLARRIASADHLAGGRSGLVLGLADGYAPAGRDADGAWGGAGLTPGVPLGVQTARDAAATIRDLWLSWPYASIVADRATGVYARGEQIVHIDHRGAFAVDGPLTVPTTPQGSPVLAWYARSAAEAAAAAGVADILIAPARTAATAAALAAAGPVRPASAGQPAAAPRLFLEIPAGDAGLPGYLGDVRVAGVLVRPPGDERALREFLRSIPASLRGAGDPGGSPDRTGTLRERLSLPAPRPLPAGLRPAFPAPVPLR
jgi:alkanesulfonate monooxygenase SsuD/methylene tetrahydromethanopterin reductase-like flavin-dependent oxidoreductase (luciferase family)